MMMQSNPKEMSPMSREELMAKVPVAFAEGPTMSLSDKYVHIPTSRVIDDLEKLGWVPVDGAQRSSRKGGVSRFSKHMIKFQHPDLKIKGSDGDDAFPQIILTNSHDGLSSFKFMVGIYRLVCSNGLVVADKEFSNFKIRHMGYSFEELQEMIHNAIADLPNKVEVINKMKNRVLTEEEQKEMALKALLLRRGISLESDEAKEAEAEDEVLEDILAVRRTQDQGSDAWVVFNRIQEAVTQGGFKAALKGAKVRKLRKIKSFEKDIKLNQELFKLASSMV